MKIVIFGDSITNGYYRIGPSATTLLKDGIEQLNPEIEVTLKGINGQTTADGLQRMDDILEQHADKVLMFFGANDAAYYVPITSVDYEKNLCQMVEKIGKDKVILMTSPYCNETLGDGTRKNSYVIRYVSQSKQVAQKYDLPLIDVYQAMINQKNPDSWLQSDGLHFSEWGYENLARLIVATLEDLK
ncbi:MAG: GDSL-type esterase/lipase family protein [Streptococcaceae bacterium]|nr:GDSL-type esterase/lipase family protein [Streptococcaceae bacterium]